MTPRARFWRETRWLEADPAGGFVVAWRAAPGQAVQLAWDDPRPWLPGPALAQALPAATRARPGWFDGPTLRVCGLRAGAGGLTLRVRPTRYRAYLGGAWAVAHLPAAACRAAWAAFDEGTGRLAPLDPHARLGHTLGVSALVEVGDEVVLLRQGPGAVASAGLLVPSASGAAEPPAPGVPLDAGADVRREVAEELGLPAACLVAVEPLALLRDARRGGKPELFFRVRAAATRSQVRVGPEHAGGPVWLPARHRPEAAAAWGALLGALPPAATILGAAARLYLSAPGTSAPPR